jgi:hypothetical protein
MTKEFEQLGTIEDMIGFIAGGDIEDMEEDEIQPEMTAKDTSMDLETLNVQIFLKLLPHYQALTPEMKSHFDDAVLMFANPGIDPLTRHSALALIHEMLLPEPADEKQITRKDKIYNIPCEDCETKPTHMVEFKQGDRSEQHYLCEECEKAARKE